jgi:hypothetical protein
MLAGVRPANHHRVAFRWQSANYVQRFGHHAGDTRAAVAVRCKITYGPIEAIKAEIGSVRVYIFLGFAL